jgi:ABC-type glycerol-3-phosphate transport system substrate-binding protein
VFASSQWDLRRRRRDPLQQGPLPEAGLDPDAPPTTWADLITSVKALRKAGFTPFGAGVKDGWFGVVS